ncbi:MAG: MFS transporter [Bacillota bacterium]
MNKNRLPRHNPYAAFRYRNFNLFITGHLLTMIGGAVQGLAIRAEIYDRTDKVIALGMAALVQALPMLLFTLPAGYLADTRNRKTVSIMGLLGSAASSLGLALVSISRGPVNLIFVLLCFNAFFNILATPARTAILPSLIPAGDFENAVNWRTTSFHIAAVLGPILGGYLVAWRAYAAYVLCAAACVVFCILLVCIKQELKPQPPREGPIHAVLEGIRFVFRRKMVLSAISLDLFAVFFGGAVYLMPVYAKDILHTGKLGLGYLTAAPALGALCVALVMSHLPPMKRAGRNLLVAVAGFGFATVVFGISQTFWLSWAMLFLTGAFDNVSIVVRHTLVQLQTPESMRGRVSAVNSVFIGSSNELGGVESGLTANWFGAVVSVVSGGIGTLLVVAAIALCSPDLRRFGSLSGAVQEGAVDEVGLPPPVPTDQVKM